MVEVRQEKKPEQLQPLRLLRKYWLLLLVFDDLWRRGRIHFGRGERPRDTETLLLEVQNSEWDLAKMGAARSAMTRNDEVNIQTQMNMLHSGSFLRRGAERMQSETVPLAPTGRDIFSRLRQRIHPVTQDPLETAQNGSGRRDEDL